MPPANSNTGELVKLKIISFKDATYDQKDKEFNVMFNPQEYTLKYNIDSDSSQGMGTSGSDQTFKKITPEDLSLEFMIDGTGATGEVVNVPNKVIEFLDVTYNYKGDEHRPRYLRISWGTLVFKCVLKSASVKYTLFKPDGTPIRAKLNTTFGQFKEDELRAAEESDSSPDLTHRRTVQDGDTLPLMCYRIYGDSKYYLQVAAANGLTNFRNLEAGQEIYFPPLTD
ncbi:CIS tube protein [Fodinibius salsisoli]|uniref:LysM peptidoglycan-binding domain-containing protein n=1 Tax=Fodinibius salsisoli TaxID=2820877 RepID=A0ABT3PQN1_9BACT|nr:hypothetical protein [Fodinibius salsisoli]MCW9708159.1 LysM peptidoglycan-binding domain-containing protein [Fodinibius salsisoli]